MNFSAEGHCVGVSRGINNATFWNEQGQTVDFLHEDIISTAVSPDTQYVATGGRDKKIYLWDRATQKLLNTLSGHTGPIIHLAFSPDSKHLVSTGSRVIEIEEKDGVEYMLMNADNHIDKTAKVMEH